MRQKEIFENMQKTISYLIILMVVFFGTTSLSFGQVIPPGGAKASTGFNIADQFSFGTLEVNVTGITGSTQVRVTLPQGVTYEAGSAMASAGNVTESDITDLNKPVFTLTGGSVIFTIKKKASKTAYEKARGVNGSSEIKDKVEILATGTSTDSNGYVFNYPEISVQGVVAHTDAYGASGVKTFQIRNGGNATLYDIYFYVEYPAGIVHKKISFNGTELTPTSQTTTRYNYKIQRSQLPSGGLTNNQSITINHEYDVNICGTKNITYKAGWGESANNLYQENSATRSVTAPTGAPYLNMQVNQNKTYFIPSPKGICDTYIGDYVITYKNEGTSTSIASAMRNVVMRMQESYVNTAALYIPSKVELLNPDNHNEVVGELTATTSHQYKKVYTVDFSSIQMVSGKESVSGLSDLDGEGKYNDLASGKEITLRIRLQKETPVNCVEDDPFKKTFSVARVIQFGYTNNCGTVIAPEGQRNLGTSVLTRSLHGMSDSSAFPQVLDENATIAGGFSFGGSTFTSSDVKKGGGSDILKYIQYELELPAGLKVSNIKWTDRNGTPLSTSPTVTQNGNKVIISGPKRSNIIMEYVTMDFTNDCTGGLGERPIKYNINYVEENNGQTCVLKMVCAQKNIRFICPQTCTDEGPVIERTSGRRADNSLGWTDHTMTTRATATSVDPIDLKRSLYLDDIEITAEGRQNRGTTDNLYYTFLTENRVSLKPLSIKVKFFRSGTQIGTEQILTDAVATVANEGQKKRITWDLSSVLPVGGLLQDDKFTIVASYTVDAQYAYNQDVLVGNSSHFYMLKPSDNKKYYCGVPIIPDFYTAGTYTINGSNDFLVEGCEERAIGYNMSYLARRFNSSGIVFRNEFRPDRLIKTFTITLPKTYTIKKLEFEYRLNSSRGSDFSPTMNIPLNSPNLSITTAGDKVIYVYTNPPKGSVGYLAPGALTAENGYSAYIRPYIQASCGSIEGQTKDSTAERGTLEVTYEDYYYAYPLGRSIHSVDVSKQDKAIQLTQKPTLSVQAVGNTNLKITKIEEEIEVKLTNTHGKSVAPYTWISIPNITGIEILSLTDVSSGSVITPQAGVTGEKMYHLDATGLTAGQFKNYKIKLKLTNCNTSSLVIHAGWNCGSFPTAGYSSEGVCSASQIQYTLNPVKSEIQVFPATGSPASGAKLKMCEDNKYTYILNSAGEGIIAQPKVDITIATGIKINTFRMEYPINSGNWQALSPLTGTPNHQVYDLTQHPAYPATGLPGTLGTTSLDHRQIRIEFNVQPECNFVAGSSFDIQVTGTNMCGDPITGNRVSTITAGIDGVSGNTYTVDNTLLHKSGNANACAAGATYEGKHVIIATSGITTGSTGKIVLLIPQGFEYVPSSFIPGSKTGTFADPTFDRTEIDPSGKQAVYINIPSGMVNNDHFLYTIQIKQKSGVVATDCQATQEIEFYTTDVVSGVACPTNPGSSPCPPITTITTQQAGKTPVVVDRAKLSIENVKVTSQIVSGKERVTFTYDIKNSSTTADYTGDLVVTLYSDTNNDGRMDDSEKVTTFTLSGISVLRGATLTGRTSTFDLDEDKVCSLYLRITNQANNCLCDDVAVRAPAPDPIAGLVPDMTVCETESKIFQTVAMPNYTNYVWTAVNSADLVYLQGTNTKTPTFKYTGSNLTANRTFTYKVTITRTNGCQATQEVKVTVTPAPAGPAVTAQTFCGLTSTVLDLKGRVNSANPAMVKVYFAGNELTDGQLLSNGITYQVTSLSGSCESKKTNVTVNVYACQIDAVNDNPPVVNGITGGSAGNVLTNDELNGNVPTITDVNLTVEAVATPLPGATNTNVPVLNPTTGDVTVPANTPGGIYTIRYKICDKLVPTVCDEAIVRVVVQGTIDAVDDNFSTTPIKGKDGGTTASVFDNDTLTGKVVGATTVTVTLTNNGGLTGTSIDADGKVTVPANTPAGTYTLTYQICEKDATGVATTNCDTAKVTVVVSETPLVATNDNFTIPNGLVGGTTPSVLANDTLNGVANPNPTTQVTLTPGTPSHPNLSMNADGTITVAPNTPSGTYTYTYEICEKLNPTNCKTATATVVVGSPSIVAQDDNFGGTPVNGLTGNTNVGNVLSNNGSGADQYNGASATITNVNITIVTAATPIGGSTNVPSVDTTTGVVSVPAGTPAGTYTITYKICDKLNATNCDDATVTVVVNLIDAVNDPTATIGNTGGTVPSVLGNDTLNGTPATTSNVDLTWDTTTIPTGFTANADGTITVPSGATPGTYTIKYKICDKANPSICDEAEVKVVVSSLTINLVDDANNDVISTVDGGVVKKSGVDLNIFDNDTVNGSSIRNASDRTNLSVTINNDIQRDGTPFTGSNPFTVDVTSGKITVAQNTPIGTYTFTYRVCQVGSTTNCDTATVTIQVSPTITSQSDDYSSTPVNSRNGGTLENILDNDALNGVIIGVANSGNITITLEDTGGITGLTLTPDGKVIVPAGTPVGTYNAKYTICETGTTLCTRTPSVIKIVVTDISATDDVSTSKVDGKTGGTVPNLNVLTNDSVNGNTPTPSVVTIHSTPTNELEINPDGSVRVKPNTPAGTYTITYRICEVSNPTNCSNTATVTVDVVDGCELVFYNGVSANGDGYNDRFVIEGIECYPSNILKIFNRWGVLVFEKEGYDNSFNGYSTGRVTIQKQEKLPTGTYYYILDYQDGAGTSHRKAGWLYLNNDK